MSISAIRVLAISSGGGHWVQLRRLRPAFEHLDVAYACVDPGCAADVPNKRFYHFRDVTRWDRWGLLVVTIQLAGILLKERPRIVITTGSLPALIALAMAKTLLRAKTIWIDSIANCEELSTSGRSAHKFADLWLTQWPDLKTPSGPDYWGAVL